MGALTEAEIFSCLSENFRLAAEHAENLARLPAKGPTYIKFRACLKLIEGACRQAFAWRQDGRFLPIGIKVALVHKVAGDWLRGIKGPDGVRRPVPRGQVHPLFMKLAEVLRAGHHKAEEARTRKTGRTGVILPNPMAGPHRDTIPVGWRATVSPGGIIIPASSAVQ